MLRWHRKEPGGGVGPLAPCTGPPRTRRWVRCPDGGSGQPSIAAVVSVEVRPVLGGRAAASAAPYTSRVGADPFGVLLAQAFDLKGISSLEAKSVLICFIYVSTLLVYKHNAYK